MTSIFLAANGLFPQTLSGPGGLVYAAVLGLLAVTLVFAGRSVVKALAFLVVGLAGAALGVELGAAMGTVGSTLGGVLGFFVGGVLGVWLVAVGMGFALGYFGYLAARFLTGSVLLAAAVGVVLFFIGVAMSGRLLGFVTSVLGGLVFYSVLLYFGATPFFAAIVSVLLAALGFYVQWGRSREEAS